jgi:hypothetical protein
MENQPIDKAYEPAESIASIEHVATFEPIEPIEDIESLEDIDLIDDLELLEPFEIAAETVAEDAPSSISSKARKTKKPKPAPVSAPANSAAPSIETILRKTEENQLALESRLVIEYKTIDERLDYRFNKMEAFQRELIAETRRAARDVRLLAGISIVASIATIIITLIR